MSKTIRRYSSDFKHDAVQYVESHPDISMQDAADNLGMPKDTLYGWLKHIAVNLELVKVNP